MGLFRENLEEKRVSVVMNRKLDSSGSIFVADSMALIYHLT